MKKRVLIMFSIIILIVIIFFSQNVLAGPYGYGDSMDLKYKKDNGTIIYGYGDGVKYATSLKPKDVNRSEWKPEMRRKVINKTWDEIFANSKSGNKCSISESTIINQESQEQLTPLKKIINFVRGLF